MDLKRFLIKNWDPGKIKKNDLIIIILAGILLMIIVIPFGSKAEKEEKDNKIPGKESETGQKEYVARLEQQLEDMLVKMDGVGRVKVMITVEDDGKQILDKNTKKDEKGYEQETVIYDENKNTLPYVTNKNTPVIKGVMVVAEGGGDTAVQNNISEAIMALFDIELHKIKIVKMSMQED